MSEKIFNFFTKQWKLLVVGIIVVDMVIVGGLLYFFSITETQRVAAAEMTRAVGTPTATATVTPTPWPGPGRRVTPTPTWPPTPLATDVLAGSGFPPGFTPTPRPTREVVSITLPHIYPVHRSSVDVPVINQIYYPEPFFPPGTNNACGPVALFAALHALGANIEYSRLRDVAVGYGFTSYGISKAGMVNSINAINHELGNPYTVEYGNHYSTRRLIKHMRQGGVAIVLIRVRNENGRYRVTADTHNSIGHFLIVDQVNFKSSTVKFAGSTLGMDKVPLQDFIRSWASNPQALTTSPTGWRSFLKKEKAVNWALIIK